MGKEENQEVRKMTDVDWEAVDDALERIIENLNVGASELCELRAFDICSSINQDIVPQLKNMVIRVRRKYRDEKLAETGLEEVGGGLRVLTREETREVFESGDFGELYDTDLRVKAVSAVAGDMVEDVETSRCYHVVRGRELPERGMGLDIGTAGERRAGVPRTGEERIQRHREMFGEGFAEEDREETEEEW